MFLKLRADSFFYLCEYDFERYEEETTDSFERAMEAAEKLPVAHALRLEVAWNYTLYLHSFVKDEEKATEISADAYDDAWKEVHFMSVMDDRYEKTQKYLTWLKNYHLPRDPRYNP